MKPLLLHIPQTVAILVALVASPAAAQPAGQQVWLISTRDAPRCGDLEAGVPRIAWWRLDPADGCRWLCADAQAFAAQAAAAVPTAIFIHGNRTDADGAIEEANALYVRMRQQAAGRPFRLVIWSWPSERVVRLPRRDSRIKASWSDTESYYLARVLPSLPPGAPVAWIGYSFGAKVAAGSLELLAGGSVAGRVLPAEVVARWNAAPRPMRAVFIAAAMDADALAPGHRNGEATAAVERILLTHNGCDRALKWYSHLEGRCGAPALGYVGPQGADPTKVEVVGVGCAVGKRHDWWRYQAAPPLVQRLPWYTYLENDEARMTKHE